MLKIIDRLFLFSVFLLPYEYLFERFFFIETELKPYRIFIAAAFFLCFLTHSSRLSKAFKLLLSSPFIFLTLAYALPIFTTLIVASYVQVGFEDYARSVILLVFGSCFCLLYLALYLQPPFNISKLRPINYLAAGTISSILIANIFLANSYIFRFSGLMRNPNHLGFALGICSIYFFVISTFQPLSKSVMLKFTFFILSFISLFLLLATGSRASFLALVAAFLSYVYFVSRSSIPKSLASIFIVLLLASPFLHLFNATDIEQVAISRVLGSSLLDAYNSGREGTYLTALEGFLSNPVFGVGFGNFVRRSQEFQTDAIADSIKQSLLDVNLGAHNELLRMAVEGGALPLIAFCVFLFYTYCRMLDLSLNQSSTQRLATALCFPFFIFVIIYSFFQDQSAFPMFWLMLGFLISVQIYESKVPYVYR